MLNKVKDLFWEFLRGMGTLCLLLLLVIVMLVIPIILYAEGYWTESFSWFLVASILGNLCREFLEKKGYLKSCHEWQLFTLVIFLFILKHTQTHLIHDIHYCCLILGQLFWCLKVCGPWGGEWNQVGSRYL